MLTDQQIEFWNTNGYLAIKQFYSSKEIEQIKAWTNELANYPQIKGKWMLYYETSLRDKMKILCRIENFLEYHKSFEKLLTDSKIIDILTLFLQDTPCLFKEKVNFKLPGANGFSPHQDAPAFALFNQAYHITAMICIDCCTEANGCLEFASGRHREGLFQQNENGNLVTHIVDQMKWDTITAGEGDILFFDSYVPHRSGPNATNEPRRALFATYNKISDNDRRFDYYREKRKYFPPEYERELGIDYSVGNPFNLGNPIK
jgi:ectoine hydroxylase-related dioxygenase (phytanoyl-CoA dioxygenase family)